MIIENIRIDKFSHIRNSKNSYPFDKWMFRFCPLGINCMIKLKSTLNNSEQPSMIRDKIKNPEYIFSVLFEFIN